MVKEPWIMKTIMKNYYACLLGKSLNCYYHKEHNYLEIDVDIGNSAIATAILRLALGCIMTVTVDMGFLVEAQSDEELPERLFGDSIFGSVQVSRSFLIDSRVDSIPLLARLVACRALLKNKLEVLRANDLTASIDISMLQESK
ncbi:protein of unknown function-containing protein [Forsythia ovata]|uniref:Protein ENHANCED DISEASE RESISTANCE 2 C-terminal domain-containing protein n=1 Tax=Forsythia ovata TaxID=205694 RepID=A0ABD1WQR0_9LAMI